MSARPRAFAVWWHDLARWNPSSFHTSEWNWPKEQVKRLGIALKVRQEEIDRGARQSELLRLATLRFDGTMSPRLVPASAIKGRLFAAKPGDVVFSKIDVRHGAIGIVPESMPSVAVTSEFPVYHIDPDVAVAQYIMLIFRTSVFRRKLTTMISGTSGRKRVSPDQVEGLNVPLPPLDIQRTIVEKWQRAQREIEVAEHLGSELEEQAESEFLAGLGFCALGEIGSRKIIAAMWSEMARWGVDWNRRRLSGTDPDAGRYRAVALGSILDLIQYGTSEKANSRGQGVPMLRINNVKGGLVDLTDMKHIELSSSALTALRLEDGDLLVIRTSGSKDLVGTCAVFHESGSFVFASYLIRLRLNRSRCNPDYVAHFLNSPFGRMQIDAVSRQIMQNNINSAELRSLQIPLPPLDVQESLVSRVAEACRSAAKARLEASDRRQRTALEIETAILGSPTEEMAPSLALR